MHSHHHSQPPSISPHPLYHVSSSPDFCPSSSDRPFPGRIPPSCGCNLRHLHASSASPHFLRSMEIGHACFSSGASELHRASFSSSSSSAAVAAEESRSVLRAACRSSEMSQKFSVSECLFPPHNISENTCVPRTPQVDHFGATPGFRRVRASTAEFFPWAFDQPRSCEQNDFRVALEPAQCMMRQQNQVKLYGWYLIKCSNNSAEVAVGGSLTPGAVGNGRRETTAITKRIEKCRLLTKDGSEIRLLGLIDDFTTVSNGFSVEIVHLFLSGFPYTWERVLENEFQMHKMKVPTNPAQENVDLSNVGISRLSVDCGANSTKNASLFDGNQVDKSIFVDQRVNMTQGHEIESQPPLDEKLQSIVANSGDEQVAVNVEDLGTPISITHKEQITEESHEIMASVQASKDEANGVAPLQNEPQDDSYGLQRGTEKVQVLDTPLLQKEHVRNSADSIEKSGQKIQASRRITRSMQRASKYMDETENENISGVDEFPQLGVSYESETANMTQELKGIHASSESASDTSLKARSVHSMMSTRKPVKNNRRLSCTKESSVDDAIKINSSENPSCTKKSSVEDAIKINSSENKETEENFVTIDDMDINQINSEFKLDVEISNGVTTGNCYQRLEEEVVEHPTNVESFQAVGADVKEKTQSASMDRLMSNMDAMETTMESDSHDGKEMNTSCRPGMIPPPLPCPRVPVSKRLISTAFGLKTSRSGRLLVPPLAHWCSQGLIRDKDGGIIAISNGSMNTNGLDDGNSKFKPPAGANLQKLQKRLREAAVEGLKNRTKNKKKKST